MFAESNGFIGVKSSNTECVGNSGSHPDGCLIHNMRTTKVEINSCLNTILTQKGLNDYKMNCELEGNDGIRESWIQYNSTTWIYSGGLNHISVHNMETGKRSPLEINGKDLTVVINLPCNQRIEDEFSNELYPNLVCLSKQTSITVQPLISIYHLSDHDFQLEECSLIIIHPINEKDIITIPTVNLKSYTQLTESIIRARSELQKPVPKNDWTSPYHSIWTYLVAGLSIIISVIILIKFRSFLCRAPTSTIPIYLSQLPGAKANLTPDFLFLIIDLLELLIILIMMIIVIKLLLNLIRKRSYHHRKSAH